MNILGLLLALELSDGANDADLARRLQRREPTAMADLYDRFGRLTDLPPSIEQSYGIQVIDSARVGYRRRLISA